jgi:pyrimidine-nucleoside phosphorylase
MRAVDIIIKKRDGHILSTDEIDWLIDGYTRGTVPDYQMAAWAMATLLQGMDDRETADLTLAMARSGDMLDLHDIAPLTVDKHSTGGVGDKTSLVLGPLVAAISLPVAKMSGRGLGFSGGTLDKLESIPGFCVGLDSAEFRRAVREVGLVIAGQSAKLAPADKQLYALRDVTGTVDSIPLIAASIMSKKLAAGADCIVLDVKVGRGAFMKTLDDARELARRMVSIGQQAGRRVAAVLTSMDQPLGYAIGNALEVKEAIGTLQGHGPADFTELCLVLGTRLALLAGKASNAAEAETLLREALHSGAAWQKFRAMVANQGGDLQTIDDPSLLPQATTVEPISALSDGFIAHIDALQLGLIVGELGGGRQQKQDPIDPSVGIVVEHKIGDFVSQGAPLATVHARNGSDVERVRERVRAAFELAAARPAVPPLVYETLEPETGI